MTDANMCPFYASARPREVLPPRRAPGRRIRTVEASSRHPLSARKVMSARASPHSLGGDLRRRAAELRRLGRLSDAVRTADQTRPSGHHGIPPAGSARAADQARPSGHGHGSAHAAAAISYLGQLVEAHCPPLPLPIPIDSVTEALGGLVFTLGLHARSWYEHLRTSHTALLTLVACAFLC